MNKKLPKVKETVEQLKKLRSKETNPLLAQRIQALYLIASGQAKRRTKIAQLLGVGRNAVGRWLTSYETDGLEELLKLGKAKGREPSVVGKIRKDLEAQLNTAEGVQPISSGAYNFKNFYLYGMTEILTGESFILELPFMDGV